MAGAFVDITRPMRGVRQEVFKVTKKVGQQFKRTGQDIADVFKGPEIPEMPEPALPPPIPEVGEKPGVLARRRARGRRGFMRSIITGALAPQTGKKQFLG